MKKKKPVDFINFKLGFITTTENESSIRGAQLVSIRIPTIRRKTCLSKTNKSNV